MIVIAFCMLLNDGGVLVTHVTMMIMMIIDYGGDLRPGSTGILQKKTKDINPP